MEDEEELEIKKFDGKDFGFWKMQIEDYLYLRKKHPPLSGKKLDSMDQESWDLLE